MRFGVILPHFAAGFASPPATLEVARAAEALGYDSAWVTDHVGIPARYEADFGRTLYDPLALLPWLAGHTTRIALGTSVLVLPYRDPLGVAKMVATADHLSGGRIVFGIGAGWCREEFEALGSTFAERGARTDEYVRIMKAVWTEERPRFEGRFYRFRDVSWLPRPLQRPHQPIWVGGKTEPALRRAVALGDVWHPYQLTPDEVAAGVTRLRALCEAAGRDPDTLEIAPRVPLQVHVTRRPHSGRHPLVGSAEWILESVLAYRRAGAAHVVLDTFFGIPEFAGETLAGVLQTLETFAREIRPAVPR